MEMTTHQRTGKGAWPLERVLFALAGSVTLLSAALAAVVSRWFLLLTAFVGVNQWLYVTLGACPASIVLRRVGHLRSAMYPNAPECRAAPVAHDIDGRAPSAEAAI
jgi:hypothetical protein